MNEAFYRAFEDRHRGSRGLIKSRLGAYLPFIRPLTALYQPAAALDVGCGRGEWLELLGETGFDARGVDLDEGMLAACRERNLNAQQADALETLRALPDNSMALVSAFHVVEHIPFADLQSLVREALRVLKPGGLLILETPNPENLVVGAASFYKDPSHQRPIPLELLSFVVEHAGFQRNKVVRLQEAEELHTASKIGLFSVLDGVSPDYGVVGQKNAAPEMLSAMDAAFNAHYGISLEALARNYDFQAESRVSDMQELLAQAEALAAGAASRLLDIEVRLAHAEATAAQLDAVLRSSSWRVTAPLRAAASAFYRIRSAARDGRIISGITRRMKALRNRRAGADAEKSADLSPRAMRIYDELKQAVDDRKN